MIKVDEISYPHLTVTSLRRAVRFEERGGGGETLSGERVRDAGGARYEYTLTLRPGIGGAEEYGALFNALSVDTVHTVSFPWGRSEKQFRAHVASLTDSVTRYEPDGSAIFGDMKAVFRAVNLV